MTTALILALTVFGASCVESVEAFTIVLAASTRGLGAALKGAATAVILLGLLGAAVGEPLIRFVPLSMVRLGFGAVTLYWGATWLKKAVLRASGRKSLHTEDERYAESLEKVDRSPFALAFQGCMIEGFEVLVIVLSLGTSSHRLGLAGLSAAAAVLVVALVGLIVARQLREVPENTMKLWIGIMLTSFGIFWVGEGAGVPWPGRDAAILVLVSIIALASFGTIRRLSRPVLDDFAQFLAVTRPVTGSDRS